LYQKALLHFQRALDAEQNAQTKVVIANKMKEYNSRLQEIQKALSIPVLQHSESSPSFVTAPPAIDWGKLQEAEKKSKMTHTEATKGEFFDYLEKGMKGIEQATEEDQNGDFEGALESYQEALEFFMKALTAEKNPDIKKQINDKVNIYMSRAEQVKSYLNSGKGRRVEVSAAAQQFVESAIDAVNKAIDCDNAGKFLVAIEGYQKAVSLFSEAVRLESNPSVQAMLREKIVGFTTRTEQLKQIAGLSPAEQQIKLGLKPGEKYKPPPMLVKKGNKKKTWH